MLMDVVGDAHWTGLRNLGKVCVALFYSQWDGICTTFLPKFEQIAREATGYDAAQVVFAKVNLGEPNNMSLNSLKLGVEGQ